MNTRKHDYSRFIVPPQLATKNGVYVLTDGDRFYIGKTDHKRGFVQRYGTYVSKEVRSKEERLCKGERVNSGDEFFKNTNAKMYWLYYCDHEDFDTIKDVESYFMRAYRILYPNKLVNAQTKDSYEVTYSDVQDYFSREVDYKVNVPIMLEHGLLVPTCK